MLFPDIRDRMGIGNIDRDVFDLGLNKPFFTAYDDVLCADIQDIPFVRFQRHGFKRLFDIYSHAVQIKCQQRIGRLYLSDIVLTISALTNVFVS